MEKRLYPFVVKPVDPAEMDVKWIVEFLDFPGLTGGGDTVEEAMGIANEAKDMYLEMLMEEGKAIPEPTDTSISGRVTLRLSKTMHLKVIEMAEKDNVSLNAFITDAISQKVYSRNGYENQISEILKRFEKFSPESVEFNLSTGSFITEKTYNNSGNTFRKGTSKGVLAYGR
jgi:predicted RNase H-like HicB family nuclease